MALELFDVALNEIIDIKTDMYSLFSSLIEGADSPVKKTPLQRSKSQAKRSKTNASMEVEGLKKDLTSAMEEEQTTPPKASNGADLIIFINETAQKSKEGPSQKEDTPPSTGLSKKKESIASTPVATRSKAKVGRGLRATRATKTPIQKKITNRSNNPIQKVDMRVTRSKSIKKRTSKRVQSLLGSKRK